MKRSGPSSETLLRTSDVATAIFVVVAIVSAIDLRQLNVLIVVVSGVMFLLGCVAYLWAFAVAVDRSRESLIGIGGLFFLQGTAPRSVQMRLFGAFGVQVVVAIATASARSFTSQAFAVLAPMFGLGLMGLWGALFGTYPARTVQD